MPRFSLRSATPVLVCAGLVAGMLATTGAALPPNSDTTAAAAAAAAADHSERISAPLSAMTEKGASALVDARNAVAEAGDVAHDPLSGRDIGLFTLTCVALVAVGALVVIL